MILTLTVTNYCDEMGKMTKNENIIRNKITFTVCMTCRVLRLRIVIFSEIR